MKSLRTGGAAVLVVLDRVARPLPAAFGGFLVGTLWGVFVVAEAVARGVQAGLS